MPLEKQRFESNYSSKLHLLLNQNCNHCIHFAKKKLYYQYISHQEILQILYCPLKLFLLKHQVFNSLLHFFSSRCQLSAFFSFNSLNILLVTHSAPYSTNLIFFFCKSMIPGSCTIMHAHCNPWYVS